MVLTVFGRGGPVNAVLVWLGLPEVSIFGLHGIVLANVFFNMPLATRMLLHGWQAIPAERFRLAQSLGLPPSAAVPASGGTDAARATAGDICGDPADLPRQLCHCTDAGRRAESPARWSLRSTNPCGLNLILGRAALLAAVRFALCGAITVAAAGLTLRQGFGAGLGRSVQIAAPTGWRSGVDVLAIAGAALFLFAPLIAVVIKGLPGLAMLPNTVWPAVTRSVSVAVVSALLASAAALCLAIGAARSKSRGIELAAMLPLAASALVLGTGLFLMVRPVHRA